MTDDFSYPLNVIEFLLVILIAINAESSDLSTVKTDVGMGSSRSVEGTVGLVEAPVEVVGPRAVESAILERVDTKREVPTYFG